jgi:hypothetical protein
VRHGRIGESVLSVVAFDGAAGFDAGPGLTDAPEEGIQATGERRLTWTRSSPKCNAFGPANERAGASLAGPQAIAGLFASPFLPSNRGSHAHVRLPSGKKALLSGCGMFAPIWSVFQYGWMSKRGGFRYTPSCARAPT